MADVQAGGLSCHQAAGGSSSLIKGVFVQRQQASVGDCVGRVAPTALVQQEMLLAHNGPTAQQPPFAGQKPLVHNEQPVALVAFPHHWLHDTGRVCLALSIARRMCLNHQRSTLQPFALLYTAAGL